MSAPAQNLALQDGRSTASSISGVVGVVPAPRGRLIRRSLGTVKNAIIARRYRITDTLGAGGMGSVYEAVDLQTGVEVALKALQPGAYDPIRLKRLRREARTMTAVRSSHVCKVHYLGVEGGTPFIVMERLRGETLRTCLRAGGPLPVAEAVAITCQLLDALTATHEAGIIHRDVKPSNVFLTAKNGEMPHVTLIDFGLAKVARSSEDESRSVDDDLTSAEMISGTLHFLAPEQLLSAHDLDERVDVYAAGVTLFEMLTGHRAFTGNYSDVVRAIVFNEPPRVTASRPELPAVFDDVLAMAMAKSRDRRFASAAAFKRALLSAVEACGDHWSAESGVFAKVPASGMVGGAGEIHTSTNTAATQSGAELEPHEFTMVDAELPTLRPPPVVGLELGEIDAAPANSDHDDPPTMRGQRSPTSGLMVAESWSSEALKWLPPSGLDHG
jgi:serine/threonine protein kinase